MLPEAEAVSEGAARAGDVAPGPLAPDEDEAVDGGLQGEGDDGGAEEGEVRAGGVGVGVGEAVEGEGHAPHDHVDERVQEEQGDLALGGAAALAQLGRVEVRRGGEDGVEGQGLRGRAGGGGSMEGSERGSR